MPLPTIDCSTYTATGETLPLADYFNPVKNPNYARPTARDASNGYVTLANIVAVCKLFSTPDAFPEIRTSICTQNTASSHDQMLRLYSLVYNMLPEEDRWLIFFISMSYSRERSVNTATYKLNIMHPAGVSYCEMLRSFTTIEFSCTRQPVTGEWFPSLQQTEVFRTALLDILPNAKEAFAGNLVSLIADNDTNIPNVVKHTIRYARDASVFYPKGDRDSFPVTYDWSRPSTLVAHISGGHRVTASLTERGDRLEFRVLPGVGNRTTLSRVLSYSANVLDYLPYTIMGPKEPKAPLYGVELEACGDYTSADLIAAQKDLFFIMKQDGSIHGNKPNCYEMVTVPASMKAHKRLWAEFFEKVDYTKFDTSKDTGNGMHIHIDRKAFTPHHLNRFTWFITNPGNEDFMLAISERPTKANFTEWARMPHHLSHSTKISASMRATGTNAGLRGAVHYKGDKTVEVRMFKGIVSYATIVKNIEFVDSVFDYTSTNMLCQLSLQHYLSWLNATPKNKYQLLKAFISEIKIDEMLAASEIILYLWNCSLSHDIVDRINRAPFAITKAHVTVLNRKARKRTYLFKSGKLICITPNGGLLAKLDKSVQQKQTRGAASFSMNSFAA